MSSNKQHITIDPTNYQEFFLLYVDGELTSVQSDAVEIYAAAHPYLQEELNVLLATKLEAETFSFNDKESLFSQNIMAGSDESLLLYIDNELSPAETIKTEQRISEDVHYGELYRQMKAAKLDGEEVITYPDKKELYRSTGSKVRPLFWMRIAVAIVVFFGSAIFWLMMNNTTPPFGNAVVQTPVKQVETKTSEPANANDAVTKISEANTASPLVKKPALPVPPKKETPLVALRKPVEKSVVVVRKEQQTKLKVNNSIQINMPVAVTDIDDTGDEKINSVARQPSQQTINTPAVTTTTIPPYNTIDANAPDAGLSYAVASDNSNKKGSVRGFLRKATRFIERRTGINPVNEDDELLIGVVAIKL